MTTHTFLTDVRAVFGQQRELAEAALAQVDDDAFFAADDDANSLAVIAKHVGGNLRSRWTDFLTSDLEKPDRNRDGEFVTDADTRADVMRTWQAGWSALTETLESLLPDDLARTVLMRGQPLTAQQALLKSLAHTAHHCGQIVQAAKARAQGDWKTLSVPRPGEARPPTNYWK